jgi:PAS domain S-box-containing protein
MEAAEKVERRTWYLLVLSLAILALGIIVGGTFYYRHYERHFRAEAERQLKAVAELKVGELMQYRKERLEDGAVFFNNAAFSGLVRRFLDHPEDAEAQQQIQEWIIKCTATDQYDLGCLFDAQGVVRLSVPAGRPPISALNSQRIPEVLQSGQVTLQDFNRNEHDQRIYLTLLVPILHDEPEHSQTLGVLALRINPETYLYPFIRRWPTPSRTAETLLVRRDGNDALFLNELKFETNTALNLRIPLENTNVAAVKAVLGQEGIVEGVDYRGAPVLAALHAIPDSPWFLVARMDTAEMYVPLRERLWLTVLLVGVLLAGASAGVVAIWRHQHVQFYKERSQVAEATRASEARYRRLFEAARDGILILDAETGIVVDVNLFLVELLGYSHEQFLGKKIWELGFFKDIIANQASFAELQRKEYIRYENKLLETADGRRIEVEFVSNVYLVNHQKVIQCNIRDITERKRAEETIARERQLLRTLIDLLPDTFYVKDLDSRFLVVNETLAKQFGKDAPSQVVGLSDADLFPAGLTAEFRAKEMKIFAGESLIDQENTMVSPDGRERTVLTTKLPFRDNQGRICGLVGIGRDITERKQAEKALQQSHEEFKNLFDNAPVGFHEVDIEGRLVRINNTELEMLGYDAEELLGQFVWKISADEETSRRSALAKLGGEPSPPHNFEQIFRRKDGSTFPVLINDRILRGKDRAIVGIRAAIQDDTERKQAEAALGKNRCQLAEANEMLQAVMDTIPVRIFWKNRDSVYLGCNRLFAEDAGRKSPDDIIGEIDYNLGWREQAELYRKDDMEIMRSGNSKLDYEELQTAPDGRQLWLRTSKVPLRDINNHIVGILGTYEDITERKRADEALANERALLRTLVDHLPLAVYLKDLAGRKTLANRLDLDYMGATSEAEVLGKTDFDFFPEEQSAVYQAMEQEIIRTGQPVINHEGSLTKPDGSVICLLGSIVPLRDAAGHVTGLAGINLDITERKRAEEALRQSEEQLLKVATQIRCILTFGHVEGPAGWRERALNPESPFHWDFPVLNEETAQKILPLKLAAGEQYQQACWLRSCNRDDSAQINWNSGNAFLNDLPFYRNEFRCTDKNGVGHWMQEYVTIRKLAENRWELFGITTDISDLKRVETELRQTQNELEKRVAERTAELSQERWLLRTLIDNLPDNIYTKDIAGRKTMANPADLKVLGCKTEAEAIGKSDFDLFPKDIAEKFWADDQKVIQGEPVINREEFVLDEKGRKCWLLTSKLPLCDQDGKIVGLVGIGRNITERKQAEEALRQAHNELEKRVAERTAELSQERLLLRMLVDNLPDAIYAKDAAARKTLVNAADLINMGCQTEAEAIGKTDFDFFPKDIAETFYADDQKVMQGQPVINREEYLLNDEGEKRWLLTSKLPLRDQDGKIVGLVGIGRDITERKQAEETIAHERQLLRMLIDLLPETFYIKDLNSRFLVANEALAKHFGKKTPSQILGLSDADFFPTELAAKFRAEELKIFGGEPLIEHEDEGVSLDGRVCTHLTTKLPFRDSQGRICGLVGIGHDITDRRQAEKALRESQALYYSLVEQLPVGVFRKDPVGRYVLVNPWFCRLKGMKAEEFLGKTADEVATGTVAKQDPTGRAVKYATVGGDHHGQIMQTGKPSELVEEYTDADGRKQFIHAMKLPVFDPDGKVIGTQGILTDITEIKQAAEALHYEQTLMATLMNTLPDPVYFKDAASRFLRVNPAMARKFGLSDPEQMIGKTDKDLFTEEHASKALADEQEIIRTAQPVVNIEEKETWPDGSETWVLTTKLPLRDDAGRIIGTCGISTNITERKRAEEALRWSETQLYVILESTADGILAVDSKGKVIEANQRFAELWRVPQSLMDARDDRALLDFVLDQLSDPDTFLKKVQSLYGTDALDMDTLAFKDGRIFERYSFPMIMDGAVIGRVWSFRDITGRKRQEKELSEKNSELERFTYTVSHDLKSPLVTVKTFLGYLEQDLARPDKERVKQDVAYMHTAADKMGQLLDELLNLARVGRKSNPDERITFKELAQEAVRLVAGRISTGGAEVQVADAAVVLEGDRPRLIEIWQNLVENACKFMGNQPKPRVEIGVEKRGSETVFFVRDNGAGIDPRFQEKVFGLFEKLDPKGEGTGMGLALVKRIVEMYKGRIWVESSGLGQGANFLFTLPEAVIIDPEQSS